MALSYREKQQRKVRETCSEFPLFEDVGEEEMTRFSRMVVCHDYPENNVLLYQDDRPEFVYLVLEGRVKLTLSNQRGRVVILDLHYPGALVGADAVLSGEPQPVNAITATDSRLARVKRGSFLDWLERNPGFCRSVATAMGGRLRRAYRHMGAHALWSVRERLLHVLGEIADREGRPAPEGEGVVVERPTHQELAYRIGSSREVVTRVLSDLMEEGVLEGEGQVVHVPKSALVLRGE